jgi:signal transduction histidine kinase
LGLSGSDLKSIEYDALGKLLDSAQFLDMDVGSPLELLQKSTSQLYDLFAFTENMYNELKHAKEKLDEEKLNRVALESLQAIIATFSHYLNNAVAAISGRSQLLELALKNKQMEDPTGVLTKSLAVYEKSAEQITSVIDKLKKIKIFKTAIYHDNTKIIDFEKDLRDIKEDISLFTDSVTDRQKIASQ